MANKLEKEKQKLVQEKCQNIIADLLRDDDNKYCVDCDAKGKQMEMNNLSFKFSGSIAYKMEEQLAIKKNRDEQRNDEEKRGRGEERFHIQIPLSIIEC